VTTVASLPRRRVWPLRNKPLLWTAAIFAWHAIGQSKTLHAQTNPPRPITVAARLKPLVVLAGTWKTDGQRYATEYSKAGRDTSLLHNDCWGSGVFFACDQIVDGKSTALIVFSPGDKPGAFHNYAIPSAGGPAGLGLLTIADTTWVWGPALGDTSGTRWNTTNVFTTPTTIRYRVQFSHDGRNWTTMSEGNERKLHD